MRLGGGRGSGVRLGGREGEWSETRGRGRGSGMRLGGREGEWSETRGEGGGVE